MVKGGVLWQGTAYPCRFMKCIQPPAALGFPTARQAARRSADLVRRAQSSQAVCPARVTCLAIVRAAHGLHPCESTQTSPLPPSALPLSCRSAGSYCLDTEETGEPRGMTAGWWHVAHGSIGARQAALGFGTLPTDYPFFLPHFTPHSAMLRGPARLLGAALSSGRSHARSVAGPSPRRLSDRSGVRRQAAIVNGQATHANESLSPAALLSSSQQSMQRLEDEQSGVTVTVYPTTVSLRCPRLGLSDEYHFDHVWLRDVCMEGNSVEKDTRQKLFHTSDINIPSADSSTGLLNE